MLKTDLHIKINSRFKHLLNAESRKETIIKKITQLNKNKSNLKYLKKFWHYGSGSDFNPQSMDFWVYWALEHKLDGLSLILHKIIYYDQGLSLTGSTYYDDVHDFKDYWKDFCLSQLIEGYKFVSVRDFIVKNQDLLTDFVTFFCLLKLHEEEMVYFSVCKNVPETFHLKTSDIDKLKDFYFDKFCENKLDLFADVKLIQKIEQKFDVIRKRYLQGKFKISPLPKLSIRRSHRDFTYHKDYRKLGIVSEDAAVFALRKHRESKLSLRSEEIEFLLYKKKYMGEVTYLKDTYPDPESFGYVGLWGEYQARKWEDCPMYNNY